MTDPSGRDRSVSVPAESAAETATLNHGDDNSSKTQTTIRGESSLAES